MKFDYDVIVVGGGPAGSTAARFCAQAGLKTLLIEKERLPRYKACGGCLSVKTVPPPRFRSQSGDRKHHLSGLNLLTSCRIPSSSTPKSRSGFMVMRDRFDHLLVKRAEEKGAEVREGEKVVRVREEEALVSRSNWRRVRGFCCEYLIGADGAGSVVSRSVPPAEV